MAKEHPGPLDMNERAYLTMRHVTDRFDETIDGKGQSGSASVPHPNRAKGGRRGAATRNRNLTPEERSAIAKRAAEARWKKSKAEKDDERE